LAQRVAHHEEVVERVGATRHENVVSVLGRGWMSYSQLYFYDMTFCPLDLHKYISMMSKGTNVSMTFSVEAGGKNIFWIVADITRGLSFLHSHGQIHGNLKPTNGCP
jgi:serine/threonine protein kinase